MTISLPDHKPEKVVWVISDGIPGHFNQSKGVLLALEHLYSLKVHWVELQLKSGIYRRILSWLLNRMQPSVNLLSFFYRGQLPNGTPDLVIGAGGKSMFAVAWLGQAFTAKTIFAGSLRQLKPALFDAVLILEPSSQPPFISVQTAPMPISQPILKQAAETWRAERHPSEQRQPEKLLWAMLIGGDGAGASYQENDWQTLAQQMNALAEQHGIQWLVTTSRRTSVSAEQILSQSLNQEVLADAVWWSEAPRPVTSAYLGLCEVVYCTVDSMSMMMESVSAMRPVVAVIPQYFSPDHNFQNAMDRLQQQKLVLRSAIQQLHENQSQLMQVQPLLQEPALNLADQLKQYLQ
ncbi:MAG: nucleoside-diphosphate sugar epimerase [Moraxellaceae bacterium]|nr:MAG: nucleoside-diphosphate sugar epimerase [Moraxellaceae bacterium]